MGLRFPVAKDKAKEIFEEIISEIDSSSSASTNPETVNTAKRISVKLVKHIIRSNPNLPFNIMNNRNKMSQAYEYWATVEKHIQHINN